MRQGPNAMADGFGDGGGNKRWRSVEDMNGQVAQDRVTLRAKLERNERMTRSRDPDFLDRSRRQTR